MTKLPLKHLKNGFTLIEIMVVSTLVVMLMLTASAAFITFLISNTRIGGAEAVKQEGDFAIGQMEFLLRNAIELVPKDAADTIICETNMDEITFTSLDSSVTTLQREVDSSDGIAKIASNSGVYLTSNEIELVDPSELGKPNPEFDCRTSADGSTDFIDITFTLRKEVPGVNEATVIQEDTFSTGVTLRN